MFKTLLIAFALNIGFGLAFYVTERTTQPDLKLIDSIWWAMVTMTTVGYGDYFPQTFIGRFFIAYPCFLIGIGIIGYLLGSIAESLINHFSKRRRGLMQTSFTNHIVIFHCPSKEKILHLTDEIRAHPDQADTPIVVIDEFMEEAPESFRKNKIVFIKGRPTNEDTLQRANVDKCHGVFILANKPGDPDADVSTFAIANLVDMLAEEKGRKIKVVTELIRRSNLKMMQRATPDTIVSTEGITDSIMVQDFLYPGIQSVIEQLITNKTGSEFYTVETALTGLSMVELQKAALDHPANIQISGLIRNNSPILNPSKAIKIMPGDRLIILAESPKDFASIEQSIRKQNLETIV